MAMLGAALMMAHQVAGKATRDALFHAAHHIRGEAATFGFPAVAAPADSLSKNSSI